MTKLYVCYYRCSTREQGESGLGLEAQRAAVLAYVKRNGNKIVAEYTEIESGRNNQRPELARAIAHAKVADATLVVAKLDRLARDVGFIAKLMETKVRFVCADLPELNTMTLYIIAAVAQYEAELISMRTKAALDAKRRRGDPEWRVSNLSMEARQKGLWMLRKNAEENENNRKAWHYIKGLRMERLSYAKIAEELNRENYKTRRGKSFTAMQVWHLFQRFSEDSSQLESPN